MSQIADSVVTLRPYVDAAAALNFAARFAQSDLRGNGDRCRSKNGNGR